MRRLYLFWRMSSVHKRLLFEAACGLCWYKVTLYVLPFRWIAPRLGRPMASLPAEVSPEQIVVANRVAWAVQIAGRRLPWHSRCLVRAVTAKRMLQRRGLSSTLYLGALRKNQTEVGTHAWLRFGDCLLVGGHAASDHTVLATFAEE